MARGGKRKNAGRKASWNTIETETTILRMPKILADSLLEARKNKIKVSDLIVVIDRLTHPIIEKITESKKLTNNTLNESVTISKKIKLPNSIDDYNALINRLKKTSDWRAKNGKIQNLARILKANGIKLPNRAMSQVGLNEYIKSLK